MKSLSHVLAGTVLAASMATAAETVDRPQPKPTRVVSADDAVLLLIDYQPAFSFTVKSIDIQELVNNATGLAKAARVFGIPTIYATVGAKDFGGPFFPQIQAVNPELEPMERTQISLWEDARVTDSIKQSGRKKIIMAGLWTDNCVTLPALQALEDGYEVYIVADACGDVSREAHDLAIQRMVQAGASPITWLALMLELQRDWGRSETASKVREIALDHGGAMGMVNFYAGAMEIGSASLQVMQHAATD